MATPQNLFCLLSLSSPGNDSSPSSHLFLLSFRSEVGDLLFNERLIFTNTGPSCILRFKMFADVLFIALFRLIRRFIRIHQARRWPKAFAALTDWTCIDADEEYRSGWGSSLQIQAVFEYFVSGEKFVGLIKSVGLKETSAWKYVDQTSKPNEIMIRYNPSDASQYRVLQEDNELRLGFEVAIY